VVCVCVGLGGVSTGTNRAAQERESSIVVVVVVADNLLDVRTDG
jgi:threonine dehydratase